MEDAAELMLQQTHVAKMESRPSSVEGVKEVSIRDLVRNTLRMRPDRIIVGECRGGEALDMLQAMNTGHEGSMTTIHANSPRDAVSRLEVMVGIVSDMPVWTIRKQIASAIDITGATHASLSANRSTHSLRVSAANAARKVSRISGHAAGSY